MQMMIRHKETKKAIAELSSEILAKKRLRRAYEAVTVKQHLHEINLRCTKARAAATL